MNSLYISLFLLISLINRDLFFWVQTNRDLYFANNGYSFIFF